MYVSSRHRATVALIWGHDSVHLMNVNPIFVWFPPPSGKSQLAARCSTTDLQSYVVGDGLCGFYRRRRPFSQWSHYLLPGSWCFWSTLLVCLQDYRKRLLAQFSWNLMGCSTSQERTHYIFLEQVRNSGRKHKWFFPFGRMRRIESAPPPRLRWEKRPSNELDGEWREGTALSYFVIVAWAVHSEAQTHGPLPKGRHPDMSPTQQSPNTVIRRK